MAMSKTLVLALVIGVLCITVHCQLTFTPNWGKRNSIDGVGMNGGSGKVIGNPMYSDTNCKTSMDALLIIYRLIQTEAQKVLDCNAQK